MPMDRKRYPPEWERIAREIKDAAEWKCTACGKQCRRPGEPFDTHKRTLTVAHLNHTPEDVRPENLQAMCAPCHLRYDALHHAETRRKKREEQKMGMVAEISTLEEMCDLMCDNAIPVSVQKEPEPEGWWYFTFGCGQEHAGHFVKIRGTFESARKKMFDLYGPRWGFQYSEEKWKEMESDQMRFWPMETELKTIE